MTESDHAEHGSLKRCAGVAGRRFSEVDGRRTPSRVQVGML